MDMDIHLNRSKILGAVRALAVLCVFYALMIASIPAAVHLLLTLLICVQCLRWTLYHHRVCSLVCERETLTDSGDRAEQLNLVLKLGDGRWLQVHLTNFYCLWWIQILEFKSVSAKHTLIVLPDSCDINNRRKIRCLLLAGKLIRQIAKQ